MQLQDVRQLVSNFVGSLESHPNGQELIRLVEKILNDDSGSINPSYISSLKKLSQNNYSLLIDFWILRASILKEEGCHQEAMRLFFEATLWHPTDLNTWLRIFNFFKNQQDYLRASFFLLEARQLLDLTNYEDYLDQILQRLYKTLSFPPGVTTDLNEDVLDLQQNEDINFDGGSSTDKFNSVVSELKIESIPPYIISSEALGLWEQALECFEEGINGDNLIYLQAFIHYAHSTVREILKLDGNFKNGLERQIAKFGLFDYKKFFIKLNRLRNAVIHDNYIVSKEEAKAIHSQILELFKNQAIESN